MIFYVLFLSILEDLSLYVVNHMVKPIINLSFGDDLYPFMAMLGRVATDPHRVKIHNKTRRENVLLNGGSVLSYLFTQRIHYGWFASHNFRDTIFNCQVGLHDFPRWKTRFGSIKFHPILLWGSWWLDQLDPPISPISLPKERTSLNSFEKRLPVVLLENSVNALLSAARASIRGSGCFFDKPRGSARGVQLPWLTPRNRGKGSVLVLQCASVACATWPFFTSILTVGPSNGKDIWSRLDVLWC